jgi:hypothetical protein
LVFGFVDVGLPESVDEPPQLKDQAAKAAATSKKASLRMSSLRSKITSRRLESGPASAGLPAML